MTTETIPSFLLKTEVPVTPTLVLDLSALLQAAVSAATKPLEDRIAELETRLSVTEGALAVLENNIAAEIEKAIEKAIDGLDIEVEATIRNRN